MKLHVIDICAEFLGGADEVRFSLISDLNSFEIPDRAKIGLVSVNEQIHARRPSYRGHHLSALLQTSFVSGKTF